MLMQFLLTFYKYYKYYNTAYNVYSFINDNIINDFFDKKEKNKQHTYINIINNFNIKYTKNDIIPIYTLDNLISQLYNTNKNELPKLDNDENIEYEQHLDYNNFKLENTKQISYKIDDENTDHNNFKLKNNNSESDNTKQNSYKIDDKYFGDEDEQSWIII